MYYYSSKNCIMLSFYFHILYARVFISSLLQLYIVNHILVNKILCAGPRISIVFILALLFDFVNLQN